MTAFYLFIFIADFFFCLRRSGFVVGARENGLGAHPNFLNAGKTLFIGLYTVLNADFIGFYTVLKVVGKSEDLMNDRGTVHIEHFMEPRAKVPKLQSPSPAAPPMDHNATPTTFSAESFATLMFALFVCPVTLTFTHTVPIMVPVTLPLTFQPLLLPRHLTIFQPFAYVCQFFIFVSSINTILQIHSVPSLQCWKIYGEREWVANCAARELERLKPRKK